jgi:hypothetical protein
LQYKVEGFGLLEVNGLIPVLHGNQPFLIWYDREKITHTRQSQGCLFLFILLLGFQATHAFASVSCCAK